MKDLLLYIARNLVDDPDAVTATETASGDQALTLERRVAPDGMGKVVGRQGRSAEAAYASRCRSGSVSFSVRPSRSRASAGTAK